MSPNDTTLTLLIKKELKNRMKTVAPKDGCRSMNQWWQKYMMPIAEELVAQQEAFYNKQQPRPRWILADRAAK